MINVTIPESARSTICGQVICGQAICGEFREGDTLTDLPLELDGGRAIVNPLLLPDVCFDLDFAPFACDSLDLVLVAPEEIVMDALVCEEV